MPLNDDKLLVEQIFLGGQVSNKHKIFQDLARMGAEFGQIYFFIKKFPEWMERLEKAGDDEKTFIEIALEILELIGEANFVQNSTELTRLSMILGDTRQKHQVKGVMDELRKLGSNPSP